MNEEQQKKISFSVLLSEEQVKELEWAAEALGLSVEEAIEQAVKEYLEFVQRKE